MILLGVKKCYNIIIIIIYKIIIIIIYKIIVYCVFTKAWVVAKEAGGGVSFI